MATLTYVYADSTAVLGPLGLYAEPHCYDLCAEHAERLTVPRGWEVLRLALPVQSTGPGADDLLALAEAVRGTGDDPDPEPAPREAQQRTSREQLTPADGGEVRRGHLRILREQ